MDRSLLFLTSTSSAVPTGRNARKQARSRLVHGSRKYGAVYGELGTFKLVDSSTNVLLKPAEAVRNHNRNQQRHKTSPASQLVSQEQVVNAIDSLLDRSGMQFVCLERPLAQATTRLRLLLAQVSRADPSTCRQVLRCRPWTRADFAVGMLEVTPALASAWAYLEHRLLHITEKQLQDPGGLGKYSSALMHLREALRDSEKRMHASTLAANHILALCTMFDFGRSLEWAKHIEGLVTVVKYRNEHCDRASNRYISSHAGPVMMQAFLTRQKQAVLDQPWPQFLRAAGQKSHISPEDALDFAESAELMLTDPRAVATCEPMAQIIDHSWLYRKAHFVRSCIKERLLRDMRFGPSVTYGCVGRELYDERLAVILGLDDFISASGHASEDSASLHADSRMLCQQVMAVDLPIGPNRP